MPVPYKLNYFEIETGIDSTSTFIHTGDFTATKVKKYLATSNDILLGDGTTVSLSSLTTLTAFSATSPLLYNNTTGVFSIPVATAIANGYLSSTDWINFDGKQPAGNYITALTGEATASGPGSVAITLTNSAVIGKVLTGLNVTGGTVISTDSILAAFGKVQNQINGLIGGSIFQGTWNANTNTPALTSSVGTNGHYYIVSVDGSTNLNGITDWKVGDWAIFAGTAWQKVDNTDSVASVNGYTGTVSLVTGDVLEGAGSLPSRPSQLYFTDARARAAISLTTSGSSGASTYNSTTGVFNIPDYGSALSGYIPYTGATQAVNLGAYDLTVNNLTIGKGTSALSNNSALGYRALFHITTGNYNTAVGYESSHNTTTGQYNTTLGQSALFTNTTGSQNTAVGLNALLLNTSGGSNVVVGLDAMQHNTSGSSNTALGYNAGSHITGGTTPNTTASNSIYIGRDTRANVDGGANEIVIGSAVTGSGSNTVTIGNSSITANYFKGSINGGSFVKTGGTSSQFLKADGSVDSTAYGTGSVTSVAALTLGTSGTDLSSSVANGTTTPVITLNVPTASATNRGALSSADWTTFNGKQNSITLTTTGSSGAATFVSNTLNIPNYGDALSGYLPLTGGTLTGALSGTSASFSTPLPISSGGTGSATQNFVDLSSTQSSIGGDKGFTGSVTIGATGVYGSVGFKRSSDGAVASYVRQTALNQLDIVSGGGTAILRLESTTINFDAVGANAVYNFGQNRPTSSQVLINGSNNNKLRIQNNETDVIVLNSADGSVQATSATLSGALSGTSATFSAGVGINGATLQTGLGAGLTIEGATYAPLYLSNSGTLRGFLAAYSGGLLLSASTGILSFNNGGGNVLIGTTTDAGYKLDVNGTGRFSGALSGTSATFSSTVIDNGAIHAYSNKTGNYTLTGNDYYIKVTADATITLPTAVSRAGQRYVIRAIGAGVDVTMASTSSQTINGGSASGFTLNGNNENVIILFSDGANWFTEVYSSGS